MALFRFISAPATDRAGGVGQLHLDRDLGEYDDDDDDDGDNDVDDDDQVGAVSAWQKRLGAKYGWHKSAGCRHILFDVGDCKYKI